MTLRAINSDRRMTTKINQVDHVWKIADERAAPDVCLGFADTASNTYLSMTGRAEMFHDVAKAREL
jgi:hypothetical protein